MKPPPPLNHIRSFECSARHLSFTEAASELGYTQAAVSSHVRALERYIGWPLFRRYPRSLKLTEMGEAFLPTLRQALNQIDNATEAIVTSARNKTVVLSCPMSLAENWLAGCMASFRRQHPDIEVVLHGTIWEDLGEKIADITISICRDDDRPPGAVQLWEEKLMLLCAPSLREGPKALRTIDDIANFDWIFVLGRQEYWQVMAQAIGIEIAADRPKGLTANASNIALELASKGAGCVVAQKSLANVFVERGLLVEPFAVRPKSPCTYYLSDNQLTKGSKAKIVTQWILSHAKEAFSDN